MGLSRSTYYEAPATKPDDAQIVAAIIAITDEFELYGYRRVTAALRAQGLVVNAKKLRRLMRENGLSPSGAGASSQPPTATTTGRSSPTSPRASRPTAPTSCGSPTSPT